MLFQKTSANYKANKETKTKPKEDVSTKQSSDRHIRTENENFSNIPVHDHKAKQMTSSGIQDVRERDVRSNVHMGASSSAPGVSRMQKISRISDKESPIGSKTLPNSHSVQSAITPVLNEVSLVTQELCIQYVKLDN